CPTPTNRVPPRPVRRSPRPGPARLRVHACLPPRRWTGASLTSEQGPHQVECHHGRASADRLAVGVVLELPCEVALRTGCVDEDEADRLLWCSAVRTGDARHGHCYVGAEPLARALLCAGLDDEVDVDLEVARADRRLDAVPVAARVGERLRDRRLARAEEAQDAPSRWTRALEQAAERVGLERTRPQPPELVGRA